MSLHGSNRKVDLSIIIPCYNEEDNIPLLRRELTEGIQSILKNKRIELVFVDDGSFDNTWDRLKQEFNDPGIENLNSRFARHIENRGLGAAIRTGIDFSDGDILVTIDSDGTYAYSDIPALLEKLEPDTSIVTASPYHPEGYVEGVPAVRLILSRGSSFLYRLLVNWDVHTYTSLFRAYRREIFDEIHFYSDDYLAGTEILVKAILEGKSVVEYPTILRVRRYGTSKARIIRTIRSHLHFQMKILAHRFSSYSLINPIKNEPTI